MEKQLSNRKHERYCLEYMLDLNQTQSAIRAGYSPVSAAQQSSELMKNPKIRARIDFLMAERSRRTGVNADRVIRELARIAFVNPVTLVNMDDATVRDDAPDDDTAAIASVKVKQMFGEHEGIEREVRFADKIKALELLGKHMGLFEKDNRLTLETAVRIVDDVPEDG